MVPLDGAVQPWKELFTDTARVSQRAHESYDSIGHCLDNFPGDISVAMMDLRCEECAVVGATPSFCNMFGWPIGCLLGKTMDILLRGLPPWDISRSARRNLQNYTVMCRAADLFEISEVTHTHSFAHQDGKQLHSCRMRGFCRVRGERFVLDFHSLIADGPMTPAQWRDTREKAREALRNIRRHLKADSIVNDPFCGRAMAPVPDFSFFQEQLQSQCVLLNGGFTAMRRESSVLAQDCLVFSAQALRPTKQGLEFAVRVGGVTPFSGLPRLGFTRRKPEDTPTLYPDSSRYCGSSVLIGADGEACARDKSDHFPAQFRKAFQAEVQTWVVTESGDSCSKPSMPKAPVALVEGDVLRCVYLFDGILQLFCNDIKVLEFDVQRPVNRDEQYYAMIDVCFSVASLTVLPLVGPPIARDKEAFLGDGGIDMAGQVSMGLGVARRINTPGKITEYGSPMLNTPLWSSYVRT